MISPINIRVNRQRMGDYDREHIVEGGEMVFSWALDADCCDAVQSACRVVVSDGALNDLFDSEWLETAAQEVRLTESGWPRGQQLTVRVLVRDALGGEGAEEADLY